MNKFVIVSFLDKFPHIFPKSEWPLHVTILRPFNFKGDVHDLMEILEIFCLRTNKIKTFGKLHEMFGVNNDIPVVELENTDEIQNLWEKIQKQFAPLISFEKSKYDKFRPHVTTKGNRKIDVGESIVIKALSLIGLGKEKRIVVCTYNLK